MKTLNQLRFPALALALLLTAALSSAPAHAYGEHPESALAEEYTKSDLMGQLDCMLRSRNEETRAGAMQDIVSLATRPHHHPSFVRWTPEFKTLQASDFRPLLPLLLEAYEGEPNPGTRTLAAVAIHAVGDEAGIYQLWALADREPSDVVRARTSRLIANYYVQAYPTLQGDTRITRAKVRRAQRTQRQSATELLVRTEEAN